MYWSTFPPAGVRLKEEAKEALSEIADLAPELVGETTIDSERVVQYHLEHHLLMTVPHYNLPRFHKMLGDRGFLEDACGADGYCKVLRRAFA